MVSIVVQKQMALTVLVAVIVLQLLQKTIFFWLLVMCYLLLSCLTDKASVPH